MTPDESESVIDTTIDGEQRVFLGDVRWKTFEALLHDVGDPRGRFAYDRGLLEIMSPSSEHEHLDKLLARFVEVLTEELRMPIRSLRSTTLRRRDLKRGIEADEAYYIGHDPLMGKRRRLDLRRDPPPDLAIEVDISRSSLVRMRVHAAIGIAEVWRWHGDRFEIWRLLPDGEYHLVERSVILPMLPISGLKRFLSLRHERNETELVREFRQWVAAGFPTAESRP
jgi:Uma2 family endonuclease